MGKQKKIIKIKCEGTQYVDFHILNEFQEDIKTITREDLDKLKESITTRGYIKPGFIWKHDKKLWILDMHQRKKALTELEKEGWYIPLIPIVEIFADTLEEAKDAVIVFTSQHGKLDEGKLKIYIQKYQIKMQTLVIRNEPIKIELQQNKETKQDDEIPKDVKPVTKVGDLWELGEHRVLCGDSRKKQEVEKLINENVIDLVFSDPPYGIKEAAGKNKSRSCKAVSKDYGNKKWDNKIPDKECFDNMFNICKKIMIFGGNYFVEYLKNSSCWIVWDKDNGNTHFADCELIYTSLKTAVRKYKFKWQGMLQENMKIKEFRYHPTQKPVGLLELIINDYTNKLQKIIDLFLGSGSTLIACEKTNRICYGIEIEPHYCDIIVKRYIDWCQKNNRPVSVKLNGKVFDIRRFNQ